MSFFEQVKIGDDRITYICSNKFRDARKTIDLKSFEQEIKIFESDLHNLNLRGSRSKIYKLSDKLLKLNNAEQKDLTDKHVKSFYSSIRYDEFIELTRA